MKILAIDSSGLMATVALLEDDLLLAEYSIQHKKTHSQMLMPMLEDIRQRIDLDLEQIDALAITSGPGSFTGLRIGSAMVQGLSYVLSIPIIPVSTLEALAYNAYGYGDLVCPIMDARRGQVYTGIYSFCDKKENRGVCGGYSLQIQREPSCMDIAELIQDINARNQKVMWIGDGIPAYREKIAASCTVPYTYAPASMNRQRAASVGVAAFDLYQQGAYVTWKEYDLEYLRKPQAERERDEKLENK